jgi:phosphopantetheine adenylyltransferase
LIKESSALGGDVSKLVPVHVQNALVGKFIKGK